MRTTVSAQDGRAQPVKRHVLPLANQLAIGAEKKKEKMQSSAHHQARNFLTVVPLTVQSNAVVVLQARTVTTI